MKFVTLFTASLVLTFSPICGQNTFKFRPATNINVTGVSADLPLAWAGGMNSAQYGTIDLNLDGLDDLVIFDRTTNKLNTFTNNGSSYKYAPSFEYYFPLNINSWMLLADYNCDGKKDIFANTTFGLKVYQNNSADQLSFELQEDPLLTESGGLMVNLQVSSSDLPAISDVDGDGDLDILVFNFSTGSSVEYHQNQSIESDGSCNNLQYKLITSNWGAFHECSCGEYAFGETCDELGGRQQHAGGKSVLAIDQDLDGDMELIFGDEFCSNIAYMHNYGDADNPVFTEAQLNYPNATNPIDFFIFPGLFYEDLNFDGRKDLLASPNVFYNFGQMVDFKNASYFYPNDGVTGSEVFNFQSDEFLQDQMIELGESAVPAFFDVDGDGDQDMIVGHQGNQQGGFIVSNFQLYENTGSISTPSFQLTDEDYLGLSSALLKALKPSFGDLDGDGRIDLMFSAADVDGQTSVYYFLNESNNGFQPTTNLPETVSFTIESGDHPNFNDLNNDGKADLLLGRRAGRLEYWRNSSSNGSLSFELIDDAVAGIIDDSFRRELAPVTGDINNDGQLELLTTDATGVMRTYRNFLQTEISPELFDLIIEPEVDAVLMKSRWGHGASIAIAQISTGLPHLVIGSRQGGLFLLENYSEAGGGTGVENFTLEMFPNPGVELITLRGNQNFTMEIYNSLGQLILGNRGEPEQSLIRFDSRLLRPGIYLISGLAASGQSQHKKLIVAR